LDEICQVRPPLHTLKIWGAGVYSPRSYGAAFVFLFVCFFVRHATMLGTESLDGSYTHGTWRNGHKLLDTFSFRSSFRFRYRSRSSSSSTTSGDIFYCSGSRQL